MENYSLKLKLAMAAVPALWISAAMFWVMPEIFFGWSFWEILGVWIGVFAIIFIGTLVMAMACRIAYECILEAKMAKKTKKNTDPIQMYGREWRYVSRETVCRTSEVRRDR